jgi:TolA-binding protein
VLEQEPARPLPRQAPLTLVAAGRVAALFAVTVFGAGCAEMAEVTGTATQQDMVDLRRDLATLQGSVGQLKARIDGLGPQADARLREQMVELERRTSALNGRMEGLSTTIGRLTARVDELSTRLQAFDRQARGPRPAPGPAAPAAPSPVTATPPPTATRPATASPPATAGPAVAAVPPAAAVPPPSPAPPPAPGPPSPSTRPTTGSLQPQDLYQAAYIDFSKGSYSLAIAGFREFLRRYPDVELSDNAQYWIAEAHLALARGHADAGKADQSAQALQLAVQEFRKVVANYPRGDKAPTALYKEALALIDMKQPQLAQQRLQYLVENFPQAEETPLAKDKLAALKER